MTWIKDDSPPTVTWTEDVKTLTQTIWVKD